MHDPSSILDESAAEVVIQSVAKLRSTMVSIVTPGPNPNSTPGSNPSPVVAFPSLADLLLISSRTKNTLGLHMFPYSVSKCRVALNLSFVKSMWSSNLFETPGPPGWTP
ncbi:hypothetical protein NC652_000423 [Populus alba x Populus x berolinensis]|nr:hypothetical protein NC652_000423 [Populus alba x Populus x berolinensis]